MAHVGDSRAYLFRDGSLARLTQDHSLVEELVRRGKLTEEQAAEHPQRSIITRALGIDPEVEVDTWTYPARAGDVVLLCSDGLTSMINEDQIAAVLSQEPDLDRAGEQLIALANEAGGRDNITVILFRLEDVGGGDDLADQPTVVGLAPAAPVETSDGEHGTSSSTGAAAGARRSATLTATAPSRQRSRTQEPLRPEPPRTVTPPVRRVGRPEVPVAPGRRRGPRRFAKPLAALLAVVIVLFLVGGGGYLATRQLFFVGTDSQGIVTVFRGLPYELPFGVRLYEQFYVSGVPAQFVPAARRAKLFNHQLRSQSDAISLVHAAELGQLSG